MEQGTYSIEKSTVECYKIRHSSGMYWADITIDSQGTKGRIQIASDFGSYQNFWGACGVSFKAFLTRLDIHYTAGKFGCDRWVDIDLTIKNFKRRVLEQRRFDGLDKMVARRVFDEIKGLEGCSSSEELIIAINDSKSLMKFFNYTPELSHNITPQFRKFWANVWPVLIEQFKKETEAPVEAQI